MAMTVEMARPTMGAISLRLKLCVWSICNRRGGTEILLPISDRISKYAACFSVLDFAKRVFECVWFSHFLFCLLLFLVLSNFSMFDILSIPRFLVLATDFVRSFRVLRVKYI